MQDFDGVAVEDRDDLAGEISNGSGGAEQEEEIARARTYVLHRNTSEGETKRRTFDETEPSVHR